MRASSAPRRVKRGKAGAIAVLVAVAAAVSVVGGWAAAPAEATSYRFWSYWTGGSDWTFSNQGAARRPADGAVDGWRFAVSAASSSTVTPRHSPSFGSLCAGTSAEDGMKRVGLVIDFGTTSDAPDGESPPAMITDCAVVPGDANGYEVLLTVAQLRTESGLICGMNGYPATECGEPVADPSPSPSAGAGNNGSGNDGSTNAEGSSSGSSGTEATGSGSAGSNTPATSGSKSGEASKNEAKVAKGDREKAGKGAGTTSSDPTSRTPDAAAAAAANTPPVSPNDGSPVGLIAGLLVVVVIAITAVVLRRKPGGPGWPNRSSG